MARLRWMENSRAGEEGTTCTHANKLFFDDENAYINASASGTLDLVATTIAITGDLTVGVSDTGHDVKFYGATASTYLHWDQADDRLKLVLAGMDIGATDYSIDIATPSTAVFKLVSDDTIVSDANQSILVDISAQANAGFIKVILDASTVKYIALYDAKTS